MRSPLVLAALLATASCATEEPDERPANAEYIVPAITRPYCDTAACHSSATEREGLALDTLEGFCSEYDGPLTEAKTLSSWTAGNGVSGVRMPLDSPLPEKDHLLLARFDREGGENAIDIGGVLYGVFAGCPEP